MPACVRVGVLLVSLIVGSAPLFAQGQVYGVPDRGQPGDEMIQNYLAREARRLDAGYLAGIATLDDWQKQRDRLEREYLIMLGLWPAPERTPLRATVTGTLKEDGYSIDLLHYQSMPRLYVTGNLYRPADVKPGERLPAVFYVCGHADGQRNGNKTSFQSVGIWLAKHGYLCLNVDTLQLGEIAATHHGTYSQDRWWWHSRGYTPAGVECWNGIRGIDYLTSRDDVDPQRIIVTGISGGGASTFWIAAADPRVKVAIPTSGMADLESYVGNRVINGHCDCMFLYNSYQWPWTQIAALIAPRAMLFVNSDHDAIFPMDANGRITNRLEQMYSLFGAGDRVDTLVSMGGHDYRADIMQGTYRFINSFAKNDARHVDDAYDAFWFPGHAQPTPPIPRERLRVFPSQADLPADELNTTIDQHFVPLANIDLPATGQFDAWKQKLLAELRALPLRSLPERVPVATLIDQQDKVMHLATEEGIAIYLNERPGPQLADAKRVLLLVAADPEKAGELARPLVQADDAVVICSPRGIGRTRWTTGKPHYVLRAHALLGRTVDSGRLWDVIAAARYLEALSPQKGRLHVVGEGDSAALAAYAGLLEPEIAGVLLAEPLLTHNDAHAPQLLSVLRVCDVPEALGMLSPKPLTIRPRPQADLSRVQAIYRAAGADTALSIKN